MQVAFDGQIAQQCRAGARGTCRDVQRGRVGRRKRGTLRGEAATRGIVVCHSHCGGRRSRIGSRRRRIDHILRQVDQSLGYSCISIGSQRSHVAGAAGAGSLPWCRKASIDGSFRATLVQVAIGAHVSAIRVKRRRRGRDAAGACQC